ncbi:zf-HC2 domain-containing protein [Corynebacterium sp. 335C]
MDCGDVRAALSARLDGEPSGVDDDVVDAHLDACADCRAWFDRAVALNRSLLMGPADAGERDDVTSAVRAAAMRVPEHPDLEDLSERILSTVEPERRRRERFWTVMSVGGRVVLILLGLLYVGWGVGLVVAAGAAADSGAPGAAGGAGGADGAAMRDWADAARLAAEAAAIRFALAVGLFWAAWRPKAAMGMAPVYGAAAMFSAGFGAASLVLGGVDAAGVAKLVLLFASAAALAAVWLGGYTPQALAQAWRAASGRSVRGLPRGGWD